MSKYDKIIEKVFFDNYSSSDVSRISFNRDELAEACGHFEIPRIKNLGDIPYSYRFRKELPQSILDSAPDECEWIICGTGIAQYEFRLASPGKIEPTKNRAFIKIPDSTPEVVKYYAPGTDEQSLLTKVRYNRLIDLFLEVTCYSIQNHLRTTVAGVGQIEVDEIYIGLNNKGAHFVIPCQAKSLGDKFGIVQVMQDIALCRERYPDTICRLIALQFLDENDVAILELTVIDKDDLLKLNVIDEKHYRLIPRSDFDVEELRKIMKSER